MATNRALHPSTRVRYGVDAWIVLCCWCLAGVAAQAAQLSLGAPRLGANGWEATVVLAPGAGESVSSMQFDLVLPPGYGDATAQVSPAAALAGKQVIYSEIAPGQMRIVIAGLNQSPLSGGQVATVYLGPGAEGQAAPSPWLSSPVLASPSGERVPVQANTEVGDGEEDEAPVEEGEEGEEAGPEVPPTDPDDEVDEDGQPPADDEVGEGEDTDSGGVRNNGGYYGGSPPYPGGDGGSVSSNNKSTKKTKKASTAASSQRAIAGSPAAPPAPQRDYREGTERARFAAKNPGSPEQVKSRAVDQRRNKFPQDNVRANAPADAEVDIPAAGGAEEDGSLPVPPGPRDRLNREDWGAVASAVVGLDSGAPTSPSALGAVSFRSPGASVGTVALMGCGILAMVLALMVAYLPLPWLHRLLRLNRTLRTPDE